MNVRKILLMVVGGSLAAAQDFAAGGMITGGAAGRAEAMAGALASQGNSGISRPTYPRVDGSGESGEAIRDIDVNFSAMNSVETRCLAKEGLGPLWKAGMPGNSPTACERARAQDDFRHGRAGGIGKLTHCGDQRRPIRRCTIFEIQNTLDAIVFCPILISSRSMPEKKTGEVSAGDVIGRPISEMCQLWAVVVGPRPSGTAAAYNARSAMRVRWCRASGALRQRQPAVRGFSERTRPYPRRR